MGNRPGSSSSTSQDQADSAVTTVQENNVQSAQVAAEEQDQINPSLPAPAPSISNPPVIALPAASNSATANLAQQNTSTTASPPVMVPAVNPSGTMASMPPQMIMLTSMDQASSMERLPVAYATHVESIPLRRRSRSRSSSCSSHGSYRRRRHRTSDYHRHRSHRYSREPSKSHRSRRSRSSRWRSPSLSNSSSRSPLSDRELHNRSKRQEPRSSASRSLRGASWASAVGIPSPQPPPPVVPVPVPETPSTPSMGVEVAGSSTGASARSGVPCPLSRCGAGGCCLPTPSVGLTDARLLPLIQASVSTATWDGYDARRPAVWFIGHSYIHHAARRAASRPGGRTLGFHTVDAYWRGIKGLRWSDVLKHVMEIGQSALTPVVLVIHAGDLKLSHSCWRL
ncbi:uncharacterized protein [Dendropsophus ebraccatus]|uniref:uncharacterized protein n=2 Tax=Dendropsophus ebraccatus TaxID=150705 RepID=UPI003831FDE0